MWYHTPVIPALRRPMQRDCEFEAIVRPCLKKTRPKKGINYENGRAVVVSSLENLQGVKRYHDIQQFPS
jgi:hypothetical protein